MSVALTGKDVIILAGRIFTDFADGDVVNMDPPNNLVEAKTGKNGNTIYAYNSTGKTVNVTMRVLRASADDKFLNSQMNIFIQDPAAYVLIEGEFIKRIGDGLGNVSNDIYQMKGGIVQKMPGAKDNVEGDTEAAVSIWTLIFTNTDRALA